MNRIKRFALFGTAAGLLAAGLGLASAPASASSTPPASELSTPPASGLSTPPASGLSTPPASVAMTTASDYTILSWHWIFSYLTLAECQSAGQAYVDDPNTPWTDWYCEPRFVSGYWFYDLYLWRY